MLLLSPVLPYQNQRKVKLSCPFHKACFCKPPLKLDGISCWCVPRVPLGHRQQMIWYDIPGYPCHSSWSTLGAVSPQPYLLLAAWIHRQIYHHRHTCCPLLFHSPCIHHFLPSCPPPGHHPLQPHSRLGHYPPPAHRPLLWCPSLYHRMWDYIAACK